MRARGSPPSGALRPATFFQGEKERRRRTASPFHERRVQREIGGPEAVLCRLRLMPVGIDKRRLAHLVEAGALIVGELHIDRGEIVAELIAS